VAWEAARAARAERATAEAVLRDYAAFAAWEYARASRQQLSNGLDRVLASTTPARSGPAAVRKTRIGDDDSCGCKPTPPEVRTSFAGTLGRDDWDVAGAPLRAGFRETIAAALATPDLPRPMSASINLRLIDSTDTTSSLVLVWRVRTDEVSGDRVIRGFIADTALLRPMFRAAQNAGPLLPPALLSRSGSPDVLAVAAHDGRGGEIFSSSATRSEYTADAGVGPQFGTLAVTATLAPDSAASLVIGGLPRSRLPFVYGLIGLAVVLVAIAFAQVRKEIQLARLRSEFVSGVSHELRTPLAQIRMFAETLTLGRVRSADESQRALEIIQRESERLSHLVDNVLCFSRAERGMVSLHPEPVDVGPFMGELIETVRPLAAARRASLETEVAPDLAGSLDPSAVRQMLLNLIDNALKYGPVGQMVMVGAQREGVVLRFWVDDEGPGVDPGDRDRIWQPFWRGAGSAQGGSGIGLAIVRDLATRHGGVVRVERGARGGARFVIELRDLVRTAAA